MAKLTADEVKRNEALAALVATNSITEAAGLAGITRKTLYNYLHNDTAFVIAYRNIKREQLRDTADKMREAADKAANYITGLLDDADAPAQVKLAAATKILELAGTYRDIEAQINENTLKDNSGSFAFDRASAV
ncbi:hypothetical protein FACS189494_09320 [Spirochaetia bacterium]|nr:hypothetical protein FACS189494_09320 [Spirochaetia bacterium]